MLGRRALAAAAVAAALVPATAQASDELRCQVLIDPFTIWTPAGPVSVPRVFVYCY